MAAITGPVTPIAGGERKPFVKQEGQSTNSHSGQHNADLRDTHTKKKKFLGVNPDLHGYVFKAKRN